MTELQVADPPLATPFAATGEAATAAAAAADAANGESGQAAGKDKWGKAGTLVMGGMAVSLSLRTLRDMCQDAYIDNSSLTTIKALGEGAFAHVDLAWYTPKVGERFKVAVKRLKRELYDSEADLTLFAQEVELMRKLKHKNIVQFIGAGEQGENFVVQEFMTGGTLKKLVTHQMLSSHKEYSTAEALDICLQMARGLSYLHSAKPMVIHRDLKLENVLLNIHHSRRDGSCRFEAKLADFGLSKRVDVMQSRLATRRSLSNQSKLTEQASGATGGDLDTVWNRKVADGSFTGSFIAKKKPSKALMAKANAGQAFALTGRTGSLMYMAPEVFYEKPYSEKADVFSFAIMMYEVMQRYVMISAVATKGTYEELEEYAARVAGGYRPPLHDYWPPSISSTIKECWSADPALRPSMAQVVQRLEAAQAAGDVLSLDKESGCHCTIC